MKFLFVGTNTENTGAATHFVALTQALLQAGHQVSAVISPGSAIWQALEGTGARLHPAKFRNAFDLRGYAATLAAARQLSPDWLVGNFGKEYWPLVLMGRWLGVPVALFRHRTPPMRPFSNYFLPRLAQRFFAVSRHARQDYLARGVPPERVQILFNPVNTELCRPDPEQRSTVLRSLGIPEDAIVLGFSGRMHGSKGIFMLYEAATRAMSRESRLHCLWVGDGSDARALRELASSGTMAQRHHFTGWTHDTPRYYSAMSMLAFPSQTLETFGRVSVEAQAAGVPVLGSDIGGIPETMDPGVTGVLLPHDRADAWHDAILSMCDAERRRRMGAAARAYVAEHFGMPVIAAEFERLLGEASPAAALHGDLARDGVSSGGRATR